MTEAMRRSQRRRVDAETQSRAEAEAPAALSVPAASDAEALQQMTGGSPSAAHPFFKTGSEGAGAARDLEGLKQTFAEAATHAAFTVLGRDLPLYDHEADCFPAESGGPRIREEKSILDNIAIWAIDGKEALEAGPLPEDRLRDLEHRAAVCRAILDMMNFHHNGIAYPLLSLAKRQPVGFSVSDDFLPLVRFVQGSGSEESLRLVEKLDAWERYLIDEFIAVDGTLHAFSPLLDESRRDQALRSSMLLLLAHGEHDLVAQLLKCRERVLAQSGPAQAWVHMVAQLAAYGKLSGVRREIVERALRHLNLANRRLRVAVDEEGAVALEDLKHAIAILSNPLVDIEKQELLDKAENLDMYMQLARRFKPSGGGWSPAGSQGAPSGSAGPAPSGPTGGQCAASVDAAVPMNGAWFSLTPILPTVVSIGELPAPTDASLEAGAQMALWGAAATSRMALCVRL